MIFRKLIKGILSNLLKGILDTLLFTSRDIGYWYPLYKPHLETECPSPLPFQPQPGDNTCVGYSHLSRYYPVFDIVSRK